MTKISCAENVTSSKWVGTDLASVLDVIGSQKYAKRIADIRQGTGNKNKLPAFCIAELSGGRRIGGNVIGASCIVLDVDGIENDPGSTTEAEYVKYDLLGAMEDGSGQVDRAHAMFVSPSGNGLKIVYRLNKSITSPPVFTHLYKQLAADLIENYNELLRGGKVDTSASDITRATYMSHDPNIYINESAWPLEVESVIARNYKTDYVSTIGDDFIQQGPKADHLKERILFAANNLKAPHYKDFRNLCNSVCSFGDREFLSRFANTILPNSFRASGQTTRANVTKHWERYLDSFFTVYGTKHQIPIDYVLKVAHGQGIKIELDASLSYNNETYFNPESTDQQVVDFMDGRYKIIKRGKKTEIVEFFENAHKIDYRIGYTSSIKEETARYSVTRFKSDGKQKQVPFYNIWFNRASMYRGIDFRPLQGDITQDNKVNLWDGFSLDHEIRAGVIGDESKLEIWDKFIYNIFEGNEEQKRKQAEYMLNWIAWILQRPDTKTGVAITLLGGQGTGKTFLGNVIEGLVAPYYGRINDSETLKDKFNGYLEGAVFIFADEAVVACDKAEKSRLKAYVTDEKVRINKKNLDPYQAHNVVNMMFASNEAWTQNMESDDRRNQVFTTSNTFKQNHDFFGKLRADLFDHGGLLALYERLMARDISNVNLSRDRVKSSAGRDQFSHSAQDVDAWIYDLYTESCSFKYKTGTDQYTLYSKELQEDKPVDVNLQIAYSGYTLAAGATKNKKIQDIGSSSVFGKALCATFEKYGFNSIVNGTKKRTKVAGKVVTNYRFPSLVDGLTALIERNLADEELLDAYDTAEQKNDCDVIDFPQQNEEKAIETLTPKQSELYSKSEAKDRWEAEALADDGMEVPY